MTAASDATPETKGFNLDMRIAKAFLAYSGGFWRGATAMQAWLLSLGLALLLLSAVAAQAALNWWNRWFINALERQDAATAKLAVPAFLAIVVAMAAIGVGIVWTRETLQVRWRAWLVGRLVGTWLGDNRFYHMALHRTEPANPEYRIADDSRWATEPLTDIAIGLLQASAAFVTFVGILWSVGGSYALGIGGTTITIPAYMVVLALAYGITASLLMAWIGKPLVGSVGNKNAAEGYFRFALTRARESGESIALMRGAAAEQAVLSGIFRAVVERWLRIVRQHANITWITNASGPMIPVVPLLFAAPKYLSGELSLGEVTQLAGAFVQVQMAISWVVDNYNRIAEWYASARRVMDIVEAADAIEAHDGASGPLVSASGGGLSVEGLTLSDGAGTVIVNAPALNVPPGGALHISGGSSLGKTTLVKAISGLWPWGCGVIAVPDPGRLHIVPQKSYLPLGSLAEAVAYPVAPSSLDRAAMVGALERVDLGHLAARLDENQRWDQFLSSGERQRLAVARILVHRPSAVILDDALSALDQTAERAMLALIRAELPGVLMISLGQRPAAGVQRTEEWRIERAPVGAILQPAAGPA